MKTTGFKDGNTFVLTFDGISDEEIKVLMKQFKPDILSPVAADPIIVEQGEELVQSNKHIPTKPEDRAFGKGPLKGKTIIQALDELNDKAFKILSFYMSSKKIPDDMYKYCGTCLNNYLICRFEKYTTISSSEIAKQVSAISKEAAYEFASTFSPLISADMWKAIGSKQADLSSLNEKQLKILVMMIILRGAKLSKCNVK